MTTARPGRVIRGGLVAALVVLAGCATGTAPETRAASTGAETRMDAPTAAAALAKPRSTSPDYRIQPGDTLMIRFPYHGDHDQEVVVGPDGKVVLQLVGEVLVAGRTPAQISEELVQRYATELREPVITVTLKAMHEMKVWVGGEVTKPGFVPYRPGLTVVQAVMDAGGPKETARMQDVVLLQRGEAERFRATKVDLGLVLQRGDPSADVTLTPSDVVFVPKTTIARLNQFVEQYILRMIPIPPGLGGFAF
jgi:polysaccharide export outer membrane protein